MNIMRLKRKKGESKMSEKQQSITNILQALYEESSTVKMYVDAIMSGKPIPYTILTKSDDNIKDAEIVKRVRGLLEGDSWKISEVPTFEDFLEMLRECLDEAMILEEDWYEVVNFHKDTLAEVSGSRQIVKGDKILELKQYAEFRGYQFSARKIDDNTVH